MGIYYYTGVRTDGKKRSGFIASSSRKECADELKMQAITTANIKSLGSLGGAEYALLKDLSTLKLNNKSTAYFLEQMCFLIKSGIPMYKAVDILCKSSNVSIARVCLKMQDHILNGSTLNYAMAKTKAFKPDLIAKIKAGVETGTLVSTLENTASKLKKEVEVTSKIKSLMAYPIFMILMLFTILIFMLLFIIPAMEKSIMGLGGELPAITKFVIASSNFATNYYMHFLLAIAGIVFTHIMLRKNIDSYCIKTDMLKYKLPLFGKLLIQIDTMNICNSLSQILASGLNLSNALNNTRGTIKNTYMRKIITVVGSEIERDGLDIYTAVNKHSIFTTEFKQIIMIGSTTGNLVEVLNNIYDQYSREVEDKLKSITSLIEPISILLTALVGGFVVVSLYLPMFNMVELI